MSTEQQTESGWVRRYIDAWNSRDGSAVGGFFADDGVYTEVTLEERLEGPDAIREFVDGIVDSFSTDYSFTLGQVVETEDAFAFEWTMSGTNDRADAKRGLPSTRQRYEFTGVDIGRLSDGKMIENKSYWNLADYLTQVGLMPKQAEATQS
ncbi:MAG TPA: nuclear transport factor 2 family protein [Propionibacteriaceae bacterium]|nr:nuclear transport factor 2 family protein [Propionibacteriaceae bacterium]